MNTILVTGATGFLGYHVVKWLNQARIRPRVLERRDSRLDVLDRLNVERCAGHLDDPPSVRAACAGVDTLLHLAFKVSPGGGEQQLEEMRRTNVDGTRKLLEAAVASSVRRAVVTGSALAVGVNSQPVPLDESASWSQHAIDLPYATIRRQAELDSLARATERFSVVTVCPSFTFGPDDPVGAPANGLLRKIITGKQRFTLPIGFGCLDVRDFAHGMVLAAERGRSGQRYLLSGENVTANQLLEQVAAIAGARVPRFAPPKLLLHGLVGAVEIFSKLRRKPAPVTRDVLQIIGRYAWYDTSKARRELGWSSRPLRETLDDTIRWLRDPAARTAAGGSAQPSSAVGP
jgi:dihydroflavonol-4-reductase